MPNRYANLTPSAKISQEYTKITEGFDKVQQEMDQRIAKDNDLQSQITAHQNSTAAHPAEHITYSGKVSGATNVKQAADKLNDRIDNIVAQGGSDNTEVVDARMGADGVARPTLGTLVREIHVLSKDTYRQAVEAATGGKNTVMYDDKGNPSIMVMVPRFNVSDVIEGGPNTPHPAFIVNGVVKSEIWVSKYQNIVHDGRAYSIPGQDPRTSINFDTAKAACEAKGAGWHLMTNAEWAAIALWSKKNGTMPRGNNNYGADHSAPYERGKETYKSDATRTGRVATGSGPTSWSHDGTPDGIYDLNGNVWEWVQGLKIIDGVAYVMIDNNFTDNESDWVNTGVNITTGMSSGNRILTMREGAIPNTPSMDWSTLAIPATSSSSGSADYGNDAYWFNAEGERMPIRGGDWFVAADAGVFALRLLNARLTSPANIGFRSAYISL